MESLRKLGAGISKVSGDISGEVSKQVDKVSSFIKRSDRNVGALYTADKLAATEGSPEKSGAGPLSQAIEKLLNDEGGGLKTGVEYKKGDYSIIKKNDETLEVTHRPPKVTGDESDSSICYTFQVEKDDSEQSHIKASTTNAFKTAHSSPRDLEGEGGISETDPEVLNVLKSLIK